MDEETTILFTALSLGRIDGFQRFSFEALGIQPYVVVEQLLWAAPFALTLFTGWGVLVDYRRARSIAAQQGRTPLVSDRFAWLASLGMAGIIATLGYLCVSAFL